MVTRSTTYWDDEQPPMDWAVTPKPWCPSCCIRADQCGCPDGERVTDKHYAAIDEAHITRGTE